MVLYWIAAFAVLASTVLGNESCPPPKDFKPCTCDGEGVNCMRATSILDISNAFRRSKFPYNATRSIWVQGTPITELPSGTFGNIQSEQFYIELNKITKVDLDAFGASQNIMHTLSLFGNQLKELPSGDLRNFPRLGIYNLGNNLIEKIPNSAFDSPNLGTLILAQNQIHQIGMNAFSNLPRLNRLELFANNLATLGPLSLAFKSHEPTLQINLSGNRIKDVANSAFTGADPYVVFLSGNQLQSLKPDVFANLITRIVQKEGFIELSGNPFTCSGCSDYSWLVLNKAILSRRLPGFYCADGKRALIDLTRANVGC